MFPTNLLHIQDGCFIDPKKYFSPEPFQLFFWFPTFFENPSFGKFLEHQLVLAGGVDCKIFLVSYGTSSMTIRTEFVGNIDD